MIALRYLGPLLAIGFLVYALSADDSNIVAVGVMLGLLALLALIINESIYDGDEQ